MKTDNKKFITSAITVLIFVAVWYLATNVGQISDVILPKPQSVWSSFIDLCKTSTSELTVKAEGSLRS